MSRKKGPCSDGPRPRRSFTPAQKLDLLTRYERAVEERLEQEALARSGHRRHRVERYGTGSTATVRPIPVIPTS